MSKKPYDGGLVFPVGILDEPGNMSLRDWFAGMIIQGLVVNPGDNAVKGNKDAADFAYRLADAMLSERNKQP